MPRKLVAGNWKMNLTAGDAANLVSQLLGLVDPAGPVEIVLCPSFLSIAAVAEAAKSKVIGVGAQNVFWMPKGAFTGQVSVDMIKEAGCHYCIVGHSESRGRFGKLEVPAETVCHFGDTDHTVNLKIASLVQKSIAPILCVGESAPEREAAMTDAIVTTQLQRALHGIDPASLDQLVVAYEPVWAIGTGDVCEPDEAERVCTLIRMVLGDILGKDRATACRILYGGSVNAANASSLFSQPNIDGGLVGGASLKAEEFAAIVQAANV